MARILRFDRMKRRPKPPPAEPPLRRLLTLRRRRFDRHFLYLAAILLAIFGVSALLSALSDIPFVARKIAWLAVGREVIAGPVREVIDGDSIVVGRTEIRLTDFDAPEYRETTGTLARGALWNLVYGKEVVCTPCEGARPPFQCRSYDRILATCRLDGVRLGDLMRRRGIDEGGR